LAADVELHENVRNEARNKHAFSFWAGRKSGELGGSLSCPAAAESDHQAGNICRACIAALHCIVAIAN
jgi:hypothetical protein